MLLYTCHQGALAERERRRNEAEEQPPPDDPPTPVQLAPGARRASEAARHAPGACSRLQ